jgi:peptide deformylase
MPVRPIVLYASSPDLLRRRSEPVQEGFVGLDALLADLADTLLHHSNGVGLAAPQIGVHQRAIVLRLGNGPDGSHGPPVAVVNPVIVEAAHDQLDFDGCLSLPGLYARTVRPHFIRLRGLDARGETFEWALEGFDAVVVHHEVDHLDGVLFIDRVASPSDLFTENEAQAR